MSTYRTCRVKMKSSTQLESQEDFATRLCCCFGELWVLKLSWWCRTWVSQQTTKAKTRKWLFINPHKSVREDVSKGESEIVLRNEGIRGGKVRHKLWFCLSSGNLQSFKISCLYLEKNFFIWLFPRSQLHVHVLCFSFFFCYDDGKPFRLLIFLI